MEIKYTLRMLQRGWWLILLTVFVAINVVLIPDYLATPLYRSSARFVLSPNNLSQMTDSQLVDSLAALDKRTIIQTFAQFLNSDRIFGEVLHELQLTPAEVVSYQRTTVVLPDS